MPTTEETKEKLRQQIAQKQARLKAIENREKEELRKERTRRLIQNGTLVEKHFRIQDGADPQILEEMLSEIVALKEVDEILYRYSKSE